MDGIRMGTRLGYAAFLLMLLPLLLPLVVCRTAAQRIAASLASVSSHGRVVARPISFASLLTLTVVTFAVGMAGGLPLDAAAGADSRSGVAFVAMLAVSCAVIVVATVIVVAVCRVALAHALAGRNPLPRDFRFDTAVCDEVRSWARPQWVPRWARYTLPDSRI
ncbi:hypothetical protein JS528_06100 [Bifidobacterium sp. MA2]|uniref:Uncharacterized protein n=1 Tax=Bifidobacterium santillanense TaxID=2809028 RepID=A0ABS5UQ55_9BIFI|nr:hypothetical protein [Bifidobacterium santillanense]MBT1172933.1 hypothetical protein [Bifidobacterium santillanense]